MVFELAKLDGEWLCFLCQSPYGRRHCCRLSLRGMYPIRGFDYVLILLTANRRDTGGIQAPRQLSILIHRFLVLATFRSCSAVYESIPVALSVESRTAIPCSLEL